MPYRGDNFPKVSIRDFPTSSLSLLGLPYRPGLPEEGGGGCQGYVHECSVLSAGLTDTVSVLDRRLADCPSELANWL